MSQGVSESRFYMWRALIAVAHVDGVIMPHEVDFLRSQIHNVKFSSYQKDVLENDLKNSHDCHSMFSRITEGGDRGEFFRLARALIWSDGVMHRRERSIIADLEKLDKDIRQNFSYDRGVHSRSSSEIQLDFDQWGMVAVEERTFMQNI